MGAIMKKYILFLILLLILPLTLKAQDGRVVFKVKSNHYYEFHVKLRENSQYLFKLNGESVFNFRMIEMSGNEWQLHISENNEINLRENIMDGGVYKIRIYSVADNNICLIWEEY